MAVIHASTSSEQYVEGFPGRRKSFLAPAKSKAMNEGEPDRMVVLNGQHISSQPKIGVAV